jgi:CrcB protein
MPEMPPLDGVDPDTPVERQGLRSELDVLATIALGAVIGAEARYGLDQLIQTSTRAFPWATWTINVSGCLLMGVLMVVLTEGRRRPHRLARPFLGIGILGGFTTYSGFTVDIVRLVDGHRPVLAAVYLVATLVGAALALALATSATRRVVNRTPS